MVGGLSNVQALGYPPSFTAPWSISGDPLSINRVPNYPAEMTLDITDSWERYRDEEDTNNPAQRGAYWTIKRGGTFEWRGKLKSVGRELVGGVPRVLARGLDKQQVLNETLALGPNNEKVFVRETPSLAKSQITYLAGYFSSLGDNLNYVWWPTTDNATSGLWVSAAASPSTTLGAAITNVPSPANGSRIKLAETRPPGPAAGFISFSSGAEWIEYSGMAEDPADGFWYIHQIRRAALGTGLTNVSAGATVYFRLPKRINPRARVLVEGNNAGTWELVPFDSNCKPNYEAGSLQFPRDPLSMVANAVSYTAIRATLEIFDEEGGGVLTLYDVLRDVLQKSPALGGNGFGTGGAIDSCGINVSTALQAIKITRVVVQEATTCMEFIRGLLSELNLTRGTPADSVAFYYDASADEIVFKYIGQTTPALAGRNYYGELAISEDNNSEQAKSAVCVEYELAASFSALATRACWHTQVGVTSIPVGGPPWIYQKFNGVWDLVVTAFPTACNATMESMLDSGPAAGTVNLLTDNDSSSGIAILWDALQAAGTHFYAWFPGATTIDPDTWYVRKIVASLGLWGLCAGATGGQTYFGVEIRGYEDFTGSLNTVAPTANGEVPISPKLCADAIGTYATEQELRLEADGLLLPLQAIGLKLHGYLDVNGMSGDIGDGGGRYGFILNELYVEGYRLRHELVQLTGTYSSADDDTLVAPESAAKLIDVHMGQLDIEILRIGAASREVALAFGQAVLLQSIASAQARSYTISGEALKREGIAQIAQTCNFSEGIRPSAGQTFTGVASEVTYVASQGQEVLNVRAVDYLDPVTGTISCAQLPLPSDPELRSSEELRRISSVQRRFITLEEG